MDFKMNNGKPKVTKHVPTTVEQPTRFPIPVCAEYADTMNGFDLKNRGLGFSAGAAIWPDFNIQDTLPTISWLCTCNLCSYSVHEFMSSVYNSNGAYAAAVYGVGPLYDDLLHSEFSPLGPQGKTPNGTEKAGTSDEATGDSKNGDNDSLEQQDAETANDYYDFEPWLHPLLMQKEREYFEAWHTWNMFYNNMNINPEFYWDYMNNFNEPYYYNPPKNAGNGTGNYGKIPAKREEDIVATYRK